MFTVVVLIAHVSVLGWLRLGVFTVITVIIIIVLVPSMFVDVRVMFTVIVSIIALVSAVALI